MLRYFASGYRDFSATPDQFSRRLNWEFMVITEGECGPVLEDEAAPPLLAGPTLWCMPRRKLYRWVSRGSCFRSVFHFPYVPEVLQEQTLKDGFIRKALSADECATVRSIAGNLLPLYFNPTPMLYLYSMRALMDLSILALAGVPFATQQRLPGQDNDRVMQAESWYREHLRRRPKMEEVAASVGVSASQLRRSFQQVYGTPPVEVFKKIRLHEAMRLLSDTDMTLELVAASSGFTSAVDFHRCFKAEAGVTPDAWRRRLLDETRVAEPLRDDLPPCV